MSGLKEGGGDLPPDPARRNLLARVGAAGIGIAAVMAASPGYAGAEPQQGTTPKPLPPEPEKPVTTPPDPTTNASSGNRESSPPPHAAPGGGAGEGAIPRRALGKTGEMVSALGCGGHHLGDFKTFEEAVSMIHEAIDSGLNFFDNCWEYYNGKTENWLGRALVGRRDQAFVVTKVCTHGRSGALGLKMLEESLRRLQTDHVDLWQIHAITYDNDPELAYAKGGILEAFEKAKQQGKTRFVGFTGHKDPGLHLKMLQMGYPFDTVQMPLNPLDYHFFSFEHQVLPEVNKRGFAPLGMKSMGGTADVIKQGVATAEEMLRYAMSLPVATTIAGIDSLDVLHQNLRVARGFKPMTPAEMQELRSRCAQAAADGRYELYKVSIKYDNPITRRPHGFPIDSQQREIKEILQGGSDNPGVDDASLAFP